VGVRCIIPPRDLSELKTQAIPLTYPKVGKNFALLDIKLWRGVFINIP
jgi:hypothetical protein